MNAILEPVNRAVRRAPGLVIIAIVVLTAIFGALAAQQVQVSGQEGFAPDNEASRAFDAIAEEFEVASTTTTQVIVQGGDVISAAGVQAALQIRADVAGLDSVTGLLAQPVGVLTFADPILQAAQAQGLDPATLNDEQVDALFLAALENLPPEQAPLIQGLFATDRDGATAGAGLAIVLLDSSSAEASPFGASGDLADAELALGSLARSETGGLETRVFNAAVVQDEMETAVAGQMGKLLGLAFLIIVLILIGIYRNAFDVITSVFALIFTLVWMQGFAGLLGPKMLGITSGTSDMTMAIPILLIGLGIDYGIHLTMRYREERGHGATPADSTKASMGAVGSALALATITTVVGFLSGLTNPLPPMRDFGIIAAFGVLGAFIVMMTFVPSMRLLRDRRADRLGKLKDATVAHGETAGFLGNLAGKFAPTAVKHPLNVLLATAAITIMALASATNLTTTFSQTDFFPKDSESLVSINALTENFGGDLSESTSVLLQGDVASVDAFEAMQSATNNLGDTEDVRSFGGFPQVDSVLTRLAQTGLLADSAPVTDADVVALYDGLLAADPTAAQVLSTSPSGDYDAVVFSIQTSASDARVDALRVAVGQDFAPASDAGLTVQVTSSNILISDVLTALRDSQATSLVITLLASGLILTLVFWLRDRKPMLGLVATASVVIVVAWVFGAMALFGIPFNVMTAMVSALAIGIGVPFGIHVVNRFLEDHERFPDVAEAMVSTLQHTGGALVGSALTTAAGFGVLVLSTITPMQQFGLVTAMTITFALISSLFVLPALLAIWARRYDAKHDAGPGNAEASVSKPELASVG